MNVFITGIAGFLGSHIAEHMMGKGHDVSGCDNFVGGEISNIVDISNRSNGEIKFHVTDCCDYLEMLNIMDGIDIVYHCAASPHEGLSVFSPTVINKNTYMSTIGTLAAAIESKVKRFVFFSSMARYGEIHTPFNESDNGLPQDPYGICKLAAEKQVEVLCDIHGVEWSIAVPHNIIGVRQKYTDPYRNVVSIMINLMLSGRQPIVYGDGLQTRCFSPVEDMLDIICRLGTDEKAKSNVFNVGPDKGEITILDLADKIHSIMSKKGLIDFKLNPIYYPDRPQEVKNAFSSSDKIRSHFGYKKTFTIEDCLEKMITDISRKGSKEFEYCLDIEINNEKTPQTWKNKVF